MNLRKTIAASILGLGAIVLAAQTPTEMSGQDAKADKKAKLKAKLKDFLKNEQPPSSPDAKPAPSDINPPAAPAKPMATIALAKIIDQAIDQRLAAAQIKPSPQTTDAEFLRRVYLDITGIIPIAGEGRRVPRRSVARQAGQADRRAAARRQLRPAHGRHLVEPDVSWSIRTIASSAKRRFANG